MLEFSPTLWRLLMDYATNLKQSQRQVNWGLTYLNQESEGTAPGLARRLQGEPKSTQLPTAACCLATHTPLAGIWNTVQIFNLNSLDQRCRPLPILPQWQWKEEWPTDWPSAAAPGQTREEKTFKPGQKRVHRPQEPVYKLNKGRQVST